MSHNRGIEYWIHDYKRPGANVSCDLRSAAPIIGILVRVGSDCPRRIPHLAVVLQVRVAELWLSILVSIGIGKVPGRVPGRRAALGIVWRWTKALACSCRFRTNVRIDKRH